MCFLNNSCCICTSKSDLKHLFDVDCHGMSHYDKLISSIVEMNFEEMTDQRLICGECCVTLNTVYSFRQMCLKSKMNFITYVSKVKVEIEEPCENKSSICFEEHILKTEGYDDNFSTTVKEQYEVPSFSFVNVDHMIENTSNVEEENAEQQTMMETEQQTEICKKDIEENLLFQLKEEPESDTEASQDGSASQANAEEEKDSGPLLHSGERPFKCKICEKAFTHKKYLTRHMPVHTSERPFKCDICDKRFVDKFHVTKHMRIHSGEKPFECEVCKKCFAHKNYIFQHMRSHSEERPYECEICLKSFKHKSDINRHMRIHTSEKLYTCVICKKSFIDKDNLSNHKRTHSYEKPFKCEICKKGFTRKNDRMKHMRIHSGERPYKCGICQQSFVLKHHLNAHIQNIHLLNNEIMRAESINE